MSDQPHRFVIQSGADAGRAFDLTAPSITIGRYPLADIVINDPDVAYRHALLTRGDTSYRIADLGSDAGTYINGQRVTAEPVPLKHGDIILLGPRLSAAYLEHEIEFVGQEETTSAPAAVESPAPPATVIEMTATPDEVVEGLPESGSEYEPPAYDVEEEAEVIADAAAARATASEPATHAAHHPEPLPAMPPPQKNRNGRIALIAAGCLIALLACCCSSTLFMYFIGGDWLLRLLGYVS